MKSKNTYKPKSSPSYKKGGKSSYKDKKIKRGDESHYFDPSDLTSLISSLILGTATSSAIEEQQNYLTSITPNLDVNLTQTFQDVNLDNIPDGGYFGTFLDQFTPTGASDQLREFAADIPGLVKPIKPTSTEFAENLQDIQERRTGTTVTQMGKTGLPTGTKQILDAAAEGDIKTQSKVADLKMQEQKMETDREKFLGTLTGQTLTSISQQDLSADQSEYGAATDVFGNVTSAYGDLMSSIIAGNIALAGTETMANAEMLASVIEGVGDLLPDFNLFGDEGEKGMKVQTYKKGAKVENEKEYDKDGKDKDMLPAGDNNMTPGEFSHDKNPIDIVQKRPNGNDEKIGEMTGGEGIIAPKDMVEIEALLEKRDEKGVFKKMEVLIDRFNKVAEANAEKKSARESMKEQKAEMGAKMGYSINPKLKY